MTAYAGPNARSSDTAPFPNSPMGGSGDGWKFFGVELGGGAVGGGGGIIDLLGSD